MQNEVRVAISLCHELFDFVTDTWMLTIIQSESQAVRKRMGTGVVS